ncbi:uncharacterized protein LOC113757287 [Coffea eugenioides]|uniref:uncharacterized protein LOC113757287 n=1 Tax=Coffea eugenioides TaxID=49369 RepID=UPI000F606EE7|nr:uncharacterized protein LOC113757287 [Coffea eugenioides]
MAEKQIRWCLGRGFVDFWHDKWLGEETVTEMVGVHDPPHMLAAEFVVQNEWNVSKLLQWLPMRVIAFFAWRAVHNFLPLDLTLRRRGVALPSRCHEEFFCHLFLSGPGASAVWNWSKRQFGILDLMHSPLSAMFMSWLGSVGSGSLNHIHTAMPAIVAWFLWKARNRVQHEDVPFHARQIIQDIDSFVRLLGRARVFLPKHFIEDLEHPWAPDTGIQPKWFKVYVVAWLSPPLHRLKLNTDSSVSGTRALGGGLVRDHTRRLVFAFYKEFGKVDTLTA